MSILRHRLVRFVAAGLVILPVLAGGYLLTGFSRLESAKANIGHRHMIATADAYASAAGREILRAHGSAVDAAIAAHLVLTMVEPQSSGIGGGLYLIVRGKDGTMRAYDGRETAPASAKPGMFLDAAGRVRPAEDIATGGMTVGIPGSIATLWQAHLRYGKLPWADLFAPAIRLANKGFPISMLVARAIADLDTPHISDSMRKTYFAKDGTPLKAGSLMRDPEYAATLQLLAQQGPKAFYDGPIADAIIAAVGNAKHNPAQLRRADFAAYRTRELQPLCGLYRGYRACSVPPSTSGGLVTLEILGLLRHFPSAELQPGTLSSVHLVSQASRLAYADRRQWIADPAFVPVPVKGLLDKAYLSARAKLISRDRDMGVTEPGTPAGAVFKYVSQRTPARRGTSHMAVVDDEGQVVSMTMSVQAGFGAQIRAAGFVLNNQLTDFSLEPSIDGHPVANAVAPGKRPLSAMGPFIILSPKGEFYAAIGSPGGENIIAYDVQALSALIDGHKSMAELVALPHFMNANDKTILEPDLGNIGHVLPLLTMGHRIRFRTLESGLNGVRRVGSLLEGATDPRGVGMVLAD